MPVVKGYVIDRDDGTRIEFRYFQPLSEDVAAEYDEMPVRGRSEPHSFYSQTGPDTWQFSLKLMASVDQGDGGTPRKIYDDYLFLKSFQYPDYGPSFVGPVKPPRQAIITIGTFFRKKGQIRTPSFTFNAPYDENGFPHSIDCNFTFRVINDLPLSFSDVRRGIGNLPPDFT